MNRTQKILAGALVLQIALMVLVFWPRIAPASAAGAGPLLGQTKVDDVNGLTITDKDGKSSRFARQGDAWVMASAADYPADASKIKPLLEKLVAIKTNRLVTRTAASHARLKVAEGDFISKVELQTGSGSQTLLLGTSAGGSTTHVRLSGQGEVYLAGLNSYDVRSDPSAWIDTTYVKVDSANVNGLTVKNGKGEFAFSKDGAGKWTLFGLAAGEQTNESTVASITGGFAPMRMARPLGKVADASYGLDKPAATVVVKATENGQERTVTYQVGAKLPDGNYAVKSDASEYYVAAPEYSVKAALDTDRSGFVTVPTPEAPATAGPAPAPVGTPAP